MILYLNISNIHNDSFLREIVFTTNSLGNITLNGISECDTINNVFDCRFKDISITNNDEYYINLNDFLNINQITLNDLFNDLIQVSINVLPNCEFDTSNLKINLFRVLSDYEYDILNLNLTYIIQ